MLKIKTKIKKSKIHGFGLFADQFIPKGTVTWEYDENIDVDLNEKTVKSMSKINRDYIHYYSYLDKKRAKFILCSDNQRYINHANNVKVENIFSTPDRDVALKDINEGEELLCDYNKFDDSYFNRMKIDKKTLK